MEFNNLTKSRMNKIKDSSFIIMNNIESHDGKVVVKSKICGHTFELSKFTSLERKIKKGHEKCPSCIRKEIVEEYDINSVWTKKLEETPYRLLNIIETSLDTIQVKSIDCGHTFTMTCIQSLKRKIDSGHTKCIDCEAESLKRKLSLTVEEVAKYIKKETQHEYKLVSKEYLHNREDIQILHKTCGRTFGMRFSNFQRGSRCPHCAKKSRDSNISFFIKRILEQLNFDFEEEKKFEGCRNPFTKAKLPFDIYIRDLNTLIEIDGEQHFVPVEHFGGEKSHRDTLYRDAQKNKFCLKNNITLIRLGLWDVERNCKKNYEQLKLEALLLINKLVQARKKTNRHRS